MNGIIINYLVVFFFFKHGNVLSNDQSDFQPQRVHLNNKNKYRLYFVQAEEAPTAL